MRQVQTDRLLLRVDEVAAMIGVSKSTAYSLINKGELPSIRIGNLLRVPADMLRKLIEGRATGECDSAERR